MSVPSWLSNPAASTAPTVPPPSAPPPETDQQWARRMIPAMLGVVKVCRQSIEEPGDAADQAATKALAFLAALRDHPKHGRNWLARHGADLRAAIAPFFPGVLSVPAKAEPPIVVIDEDDEVEGDALAFVLSAVFPDAVQESEMDRYYGLPPLRRVPTYVVRSTHVDGPRARPRDADGGQRGLL